MYIVMQMRKVNREKGYCYEEEIGQLSHPGLPP